MTSGDARATRKTEALAKLIRRHLGEPRKILVVACGSGAEAGVLARTFDAETIAFDIDPSHFDLELAAPATMMTMDAERLAFPDRHFDLVYSFHGLEHFANPQLAIAEMERVAVKGIVIGTPNKSRLIGYVGSVAPLATKVRWNLADLKARLRGRWSNEAGAHAGFSGAVLEAMCDGSFGDAREVTDEYYARLYPKYRRLLSVLRRSRLSSVVYPSVYVVVKPRVEA